jgi:hypothetical protein
VHDGNRRQIAIKDMLRRAQDWLMSSAAAGGTSRSKGTDLACVDQLLNPEDMVRIWDRSLDPRSVFRRIAISRDDGDIGSVRGPLFMTTVH